MAPPSPITVHFMPELSCPQSCRWCSYGHRKPDDPEDMQGWKNMAMMSNGHLRREKAAELVDDWQAMGVRAIELTGGGEPLVWPFIDEWLGWMAASRLELGVVTNGIALTQQRADKIAACRWKWARVSIDAGTPETYTEVRRVRKRHWDFAWRAVRLLAERRDQSDDPEVRVGVGYVVGRESYEEVLHCCMRAKDEGADNVRVALAFTPQGLDFFPDGAVEIARDQASAAADELNDETFQVIDLVTERARNLYSARQDYRICPWKEVGCVVGGDANVYNCCTLAFNPRGLIGSIKDQSFRELWTAAGPALLNHRADRICNVPCLYEQRNKEILKLTTMTEGQIARRAEGSWTHVNFV